MDFIKDGEYKMMVNDNSYFISRGVDPVVIFTEVETNENKRLFNSHFQINGKWEDYIKGLDMVTSYLKDEQIEFIEPENRLLVQALIDLGYNIENGIIRMKGRML